jgi:hypothetical protein
MTTTDWIIDIALILIVFRQLREEKLTIWTIVIPVIIMGWAASNYLHGMPTAGNDVALEAALTAVGVVFGIAGGFLTRVRYNAGKVYINATASAAALWVISMGGRMAFSIWTSHASGAAHITTFSVAHDITSGEAWVVALIGMAFAEVIFRIGTIVVRGQLLSSRGATLAPADSHSLQK